MSGEAKSKVALSSKNLLKKVRDLETFGKGEAQRPENSFTINEYRDEFSMGERQAYHRVQELIRAGKLRRVKFFENGRSQTCYVLVEGAEEAQNARGN